MSAFEEGFKPEVAGLQKQVEALTKGVTERQADRFLASLTDAENSALHKMLSGGDEAVVTLLSKLCVQQSEAFAAQFKTELIKRDSERLASAT